MACGTPGDASRWCSLWHWTLGEPAAQSREVRARLSIIRNAIRWQPLNLTEVVVEGGLAPVDDPGGEGGGEGRAQGDGEPAHQDLVNLLPGAKLISANQRPVLRSRDQYWPIRGQYLPGGKPLVGLTLPLLGAVPLTDIVGELQNISVFKNKYLTRGTHMQIATNAKEEKIRDKSSDREIHCPESSKTGMHVVLNAHPITLCHVPTFYWTTLLAPSLSGCRHWSDLTTWRSWAAAPETSSSGRETSTSRLESILSWHLDHNCNVSPLMVSDIKNTAIENVPFVR